MTPRRREREEKEVSDLGVVKHVAPVVCREWKRDKREVKVVKATHKKEGRRWYVPGGEKWREGRCRKRERKSRKSTTTR